MTNGVTAAPNRARITAACLDVRRSADAPRKWLLRLTVRSVEPIYGGTFVRPGDDVDAFIISDAPGIDAGAVMEAEAEYLGDARHGVLQLYDARTRPPA